MPIILSELQTQKEKYIDTLTQNETHVLCQPKYRNNAELRATQTQKNLGAIGAV